MSMDPSTMNNQHPSLIPPKNALPILTVDIFPNLCMKEKQIFCASTEQVTPSVPVNFLPFLYYSPGKNAAIFAIAFNDAAVDPSAH